MSTQRALYVRRFAGSESYREDIWKLLVSHVFQPYIASTDSVLDLGCGYGELINHISAAKRYALDLNPDSRAKLNESITFFEQDSAAPWPLADESLDVVVSSNFFEHLPSKGSMLTTLRNAAQALRIGGAIVAMGPNLRALPGSYWDFFDHNIPLTDRSLCEALALAGLESEKIIDRFIPYTTSDVKGRTRRAPLPLVKLYLKIPIAWRFLGKQFLIVARKRGSP